MSTYSKRELPDYIDVDGFMNCCGVSIISNFGGDADDEDDRLTVGVLCDEIDQAIRWAEQYQQGHLLAATVPEQEEAEEALVECGFEMFSEHWRKDRRCPIRLWVKKVGIPHSFSTGNSRE